MKIERVSENQIRCTLNNFDLSVRNLNLSELAYGTEKARGLFREMLQKASNEVGFEAEDLPLMVEAIPLSGESVMLLITKMEDPEELDTRFAKFSPQSEGEDYLANDLINNLLEGADSLARLLQTSSPEGKDDTLVETEEDSDPLSLLDPEDTHGTTSEEEKESPAFKAPEKESPLEAIRVFTFGSLDECADAARAAGADYPGNSVLYKRPETAVYYLVVRRCPDSLAFSRTCNVLAEYGSRVRHDYASEAYYGEHYDVIIKQNALQGLAKL